MTAASVRQHSTHNCCVMTTQHAVGLFTQAGWRGCTCEEDVVARRRVRWLGRHWLGRHWLPRSAAVAGTACAHNTTMPAARQTTGTGCASSSPSHDPPAGTACTAGFGPANQTHRTGRRGAVAAVVEAAADRCRNPVAEESQAAALACRSRSGKQDPERAFHHRH